MISTKSKKVSKKTKKLTLLNVIAAMFTTIFLLDSIIPAASAGSSTIIWYLILGVTFYVPYALITAEFASKIPNEGGVYAWVKKSLGLGFAKRVSWYYWVNVGIWAPSIALYISQLILYMWFPNLSTSKTAWVTMVMAIMFMWSSMAFSYFPISDNQKLYTSSTLGKLIIVFFLFLGMFIFIAQGKPSETHFNKIPKEFGNMGAILLFLPAFIYNIFGLETIAGEVNKIKDPKKTMPKAIIITSLFLLIFYIITTMAVQYLFNTENGLDLTGIIKALQHAFGNTLPAKIFINILGVIFIYTMFIETMGWVSGANSGMAESSKNKEVPKIFQWTNKKNMPFKSTIILGIIGTIELILFTTIGQIVGGNNGAKIFWSLFAASSNIIFLAYFIMFISYIKAKFTGELDKYTGFSNKKWIGISLSCVALTILSVTWFLLLWAPGYNVLLQTVPIIISVVIALCAGELCFLYAKKKYQSKK